MAIHRRGTRVDPGAVDDAGAWYGLSCVIAGDQKRNGPGHVMPGRNVGLDETSAAIAAAPGAGTEEKECRAGSADGDGPGQVHIDMSMELP